MSKVQPKREGGNPGVSRPLLRRALISLCGIALAAPPIAGQSTVLEAMNAELERSMTVLGEQEVPPPTTPTAKDPPSSAPIRWPRS